METAVGGLLVDMANLNLSLTIPLSKYFPPDLKIYEFSAGEYKVSKEVKLEEISSWLRFKENRSFIFQCLLCKQEMIFDTAFNRGDYYLNRSHLLTKKHQKNVASNGELVGLLFNSPQKFLICSARDFQTSTIFELIKRIQRRNEALINPKALNRVFCNDYQMYSFDRKSRKLTEIDWEGDIVYFMKAEIRPLFTMHCFFCNSQATTFTQVAQHLSSRKHKKKMGAEKGVIFAVKDFNAFICCSLTKLSSLLYLTHLNSFLEELVVAGGGSIVISGFYTKEDKTEPKKDTGISVDVSPIHLPNGDAKDDSVRIKTCFHNFIEDSEELNESDKYISKTNTKPQKNVTIYEFSDKSFKEHYADNMLYSLLSSGTRIWCSRCASPIYTLEAMANHLASQRHAANVRNNEQIGFMCHHCNVFYIELKGESFSHIHSSKKNKAIIESLVVAKKEAIIFETPLSRNFTRVYLDLFDNISEAYKFCCLLCADLTKKKLMYLPNHETESRHLQRNASAKTMFSLCKFCNVIYIHEGSSKPHHFFMEHFSSHLNLQSSINFQVFLLDEKLPWDMSVDSSTLTQKNIGNISSMKNPPKISVSLSTLMSQYAHPGVSSTEFGLKKDLRQEEISDYIASIRAIHPLTFTCITCSHSSNTEKTFICHLFSTNHLLFSNNFIKFCDICSEVLVSIDKLKVLEHFNSSQHMNALLTQAGISLNRTTVKEKTLITARSLFCSEENLRSVLRELVFEMKEVWLNHGNKFKKIEADLKRGLSSLTDLRIVPFGSQVAGLAVEESDFDICVDVGEEKFPEVADLLQKANGLRVLKSLPDTVVPVIKIFHIETKMNCDITLRITDGAEHSNKLIKAYIDFDPKVHWLLGAVRKWSKLVGLHSTQALPSPAISWLVLFYLMQPDVRVIPNVSYVLDVSGGHKGLLASDLRFDWNKRRNLMTEFDLLKGFFFYYSLLKFDENKLCPLSGLVIPRSLESEEGAIYIEDPLSGRNLGQRATEDLAASFQAISYATLNMPWRISD